MFFGAFFFVAAARPRSCTGTGPRCDCECRDATPSHRLHRRRASPQPLPTLAHAGMTTRAHQNQSAFFNATKPTKKTKQPCVFCVCSLGFSRCHVCLLLALSVVLDPTADSSVAVFLCQVCVECIFTNLNLSVFTVHGLVTVQAEQGVPT